MGWGRRRSPPSGGRPEPQETRPCHPGLQRSELGTQGTYRGHSVTLAPLGSQAVPS